MDLKPVYLCDAVRTPFGRYGGALAAVRADDLAAEPLRALCARNTGVDWSALDDVIYGCANQAGEDNRNVARMALLLAGLPERVPGATVNRLCGSSLEALAVASRAIATGEMSLVIAGGVESMSRAPFVMAKPTGAYARDLAWADSTLGWRFVNPRMEALYGIDSMAETAENVADAYRVGRERQDMFAERSQTRAARAIAEGTFAEEIVPVTIPQKKGAPVIVSADEHPRPDTTLEALAKLKPIVRTDGTVTAGNASGINDGSSALLLASEEAVRTHNLRPRARYRGRFGCRRCAQTHGDGSGPGRAQARRVGRSRASNRSTSSSSTKPSRRRLSPCSRNCRCLRMRRTSTRTAARSRLAIRSVRVGHGSSPRRCTSSAARAAGTRSAPCASASARASRC